MKLLDHADFNKNEIRNAVAHILASAPGSPAEGQFYYDSTTDALYYRDGSSWVPVDARLRTNIPVSNLATNPLARANHTGTQTASTISDFDTQVRTSRLDQMANPTASVSLNGQKITNLADGTTSSDGVNYGQLQAAIVAAQAGIDAKNSCRAASTGNLTLSGAQTIDGVSVIAGDRVLVKDQSTPSQNGIYVAAAGAWSRASDCDSSSEYTSATFTFIEEGTTNGATQWKVSTTGTITVGSTSVTWVQFGAGASYTGSDTITLTGNAFSVKRKSGGGISEDSNGIFLDPSTVPRHYKASIGDGSSTTITVTHNLNTRDVVVMIVESGSPYEQVFPTIAAASVNTVTATFSVAPSSNQYRCMVIALG